jgi:hypothetical protein
MRFCLLILFILAVSLSGGNMEINSVKIVTEGKPDARIIIEENPTVSANLAALELQYFVEKMTGAKLPIITDNVAVSGNRILVGRSKFTHELGIHAEDLGAFEYVIDFRLGTIILMGHDDRDSHKAAEIDYIKATDRKGEAKRVKLPGMFEDQGTCRATYDFLERFCGVRFFGPREFATVFPQYNTLEISGETIRREPAIKHVSGSLTWGWPMMNGQYDAPSEDSIQLYIRRMRVGGESWYVNHTFHHLNYLKRFKERDPEHPELFEGERPEFFPPDKSKSHQLCYTSEALVQQLAQDARDYFDGRLGEKAWGMPEKSAYFPVVPLDCGNFCNCPRCSELLSKGKGRRYAPFNDGTASDYVFDFVNRVAREVRKTHPEKFIGALAYENYFWKPADPDFKLEPNVSVVPCLQVRNFWHKKTWENDIKWYKEWVKISKAPVFLWNYYCHPEEGAIIRKQKPWPHFFAHTIDKLAKMYAEDGIRGVFLCGHGEQLDFYVTMKLYDDPSQNVDELLDDFFDKYFGAASEPMKNFYLLIEETANNPDNYPQNGNHHQNEQIRWEMLATQERMEKLGQYIEAAKSLAETDLEKKRVGCWEKAIWQSIKEGREAYYSRPQ